ncbi:MAG: putative AAR2 pre-mRNA splicing protein [Promethearchaeota archaeon]|nr:MAG: putative AAR2 pre-mRNA splicing protein [Candidatus Lokiarchaeota archaeon]
MIEGFWCYLKPSSVIIKVYNDEEHKFIDPTPETEETYTKMALSGAMNRALIAVMQRNTTQSLHWQKLTSFIREEQLSLIFYKETPMRPPPHMLSEEIEEWYITTHKSRFEQALFDSHKGSIESLLAEFQLAFVKWIVLKKDEIAFNRWFHLLFAFYNAGEHSIDSNPKFFAQLNEILIEQFSCFSLKFLRTNKQLFQGISYMIEDMIENGNKELRMSSCKLCSFLKNYNLIGS